MQELDEFNVGGWPATSFMDGDCPLRSSAQDNAFLVEWEETPLAHEQHTDESTPPPHNAGGMAVTGGIAMDDHAAAGWATGSAAEYLTPTEIRRMMSDDKHLFMQGIKVRSLCVRVHVGQQPSACRSSGA